MVKYNISFDDTDCTISNLKLTKEEKFELQKQPGNITKLTIQDSTILRLTEDLIGAFANLEALWAYNNGIEEVSEEAFVGCKSLKIINLNNNKIKALEPNTFNRNTKLELLSLANNQLDFLPETIFANLEKLYLLRMSRNNLTSLSKKLFTNLKNLEKFYVSGNKLMHLKMDEILKQCPYLKEFGIYDNDFSRAALEKIQKDLKGSGVSYNYKYDSNVILRSRLYVASKLDGVDYIPDDEYERLLSKKEISKLKKKFELMRQKMETMELQLQQLRLEKSIETKLKLRN